MKSIVCLGVLLVVISYGLAYVMYRDGNPQWVDRHRDKIYCTTLISVSIGMALVITGLILYLVLK